MKKLGILLIVLVGFGVSSYGQATATASSTAKIITPIAISKTTDMNFGNIAINGTTGTVVLSTSNSRTKTGGVTLPVSTGTVTSAVFHVTGDGTNTFSISLPASAIDLTDGGSNTMSLDTFVSTPSATGTLSSGAADVSVGATLHVGASQAAGTYSNAAGLSVTVNYN